MNAILARRARERAFRAACAVTLGGGLVSAGCGTQDAATGEDANTSDASASDALASDASRSDASTSDASTSDASTSDASPSDVSTSDVSTSDATSSDVLGVDTTAPDAEQDTTPDVTPDVSIDTAPDAAPDVDASCEIEGDGVCPDSCDSLSDFDCCADQLEAWGCGCEPNDDWCYFEPGSFCDCAVEGPLNPPEPHWQGERA